MSSRQNIFSILRTARPIHIAAAFSFVSAVVIMIASYQFSIAYPEHVSKEIDASVARGIQAELAGLSTHAKEMSSDPRFADAVARRDYDALLTLVNAERERHGVGRVSVIDADGYVISRTALGHVRGDNAFLQSAQGRTLAAGAGSAVSIETGIAAPREIFFVASESIVEAGQRVGAVFASNPADDEFAARFASRYLGKGARAVFYTNLYGIYGSNIANDHDRELLNANIQANSDWMKSLSGPVTLRTEDRNLYLVKTFVLQGAEGTPASVIVLYPLSPYIRLAFFGSIAPFIVFMVMCYLLRKRTKRAPHRRYYAAASILGIFGMTATFGLFYSAFSLIPILKDHKYPLYNSILSVVPESGVFDRNVSQKISIMLDSGGEPVNTIGAHLIFDPSAVSIESVDVADSICGYFLSNGSDPKGAVDIECIIPNPGFQGKAAKVADIYIKASRKGTAVFSFAPESKVLANDGLGSDVLRQAVGGSYGFEERVEGAASSSTLSAFSPSHPNSQRWYPSRSISVVWFPRVPVTIDIIGPDGAKSRKAFSSPPAAIAAVSDGTYSISVAPAGKAAEPSLIKARVDATPPEGVTLEASQTEVDRGAVVRFLATASDRGSGLQRTSYLQTDGDLFFPIGKEVHVPFMDKGIHTVTLRAYDNAGNFKDAVARILVK